MTRFLVGASLAAAVAAVTAIGVASAAADGSERGLRAAKAATAQYQSFDRAKRDGYSIKNEPCVSAPPPPGLTGAMGIHAVNKKLIGDGKIDPLRPEILLYLRRANGTLKLVGLEYFEVAAVTRGVAPRVFGHRLDGPMPGHNPTMPEHYDLHVWLWSHNPAGMFAPFNPALRCPA